MHIESIPMWTIYIHKIHIKEWSLVKDKLLSIIPWDEINQRKSVFAREKIDDPEHEMTWTDYFLQGSDNSDAYEMDHLGINLQTPVKYISSSAQYEPVFLSMISPYLKQFLKRADYKFTEVSRVWTQRYSKGDYHAPHDHGPEGFACVFYAQLDPEVHLPTEFIQPWIPHTGNRDMESPDNVVEGDLVIFPSNLMHMAPPHMSDKYRTIISFNLT
tara:strand:- start:179 stop:823 length:645 start_codon:yes stop_codon:yes gene_type:complete